MIKLNKPIYRVSYEKVKDRSKARCLVAGLLPGDVLELRMQGTRQAVTVPLVNLWWHGNKLKAAQLQRERQAARKAKRDLNKLNGV